MSSPKTVALVTLGCARNDVDSEELAGRLAQDGWQLVDDPATADIAVVNTCGFIESAKKDSVDALLEAHSLKADGTLRAVVAVGCMAERYGKELAEALPEADAILGFDDYEDISGRLRKILDGEKPKAHTPKDRRTLIPISPAARQEARTFKESSKAQDKFKLGQGSTFSRKRLGNSPMAPLKIASGCDRRCSFCAIPLFRGAFVSRRPTEVMDEARWLAENGVSEIFLVSENTTSYGKDFGDLKVMESLLPELAKIDGIERIRLSYLQPAEIRPTLLQAMVSTEKVVPYFDISFQHSAGTLLRRMRRFGDSEKFLHLITQIRALNPQSGIRSNFIVGFPGETEEEFQDLVDFINAARLDAIGVFPYSDEDNTEALKLENKVDPDLIQSRTNLLTTLAEELVNQRSADRIGEKVRVLIEDEETQEGRAEHQGPEVDTTTFITNPGRPTAGYKVGQYVDAIVTDVAGADLVAQPL
ncbi:MAG: 30S ribosomal protein S12 methylthiotransferase RimO [Candidatus Nanopelagicaceae bacterium]|nr:30S ribosomal protein S12 methylthiotransferase RimO [Candidatus Nanopelagicaceae bacterium]